MIVIVKRVLLLLCRQIHVSFRFHCFKPFTTRALQAPISSIFFQLFALGNVTCWLDAVDCLYLEVAVLDANVKRKLKSQLSQPRISFVLWGRHPDNEERAHHYDCSSGPIKIQIFEIIRMKKIFADCRN